MKWRGTAASYGQSFGITPAAMTCVPRRPLSPKGWREETSIGTTFGLNSSPKRSSPLRRRREHVSKGQVEIFSEEATACPRDGGNPPNGEYPSLPRQSSCPRTKKVS